MRRRKFFQTVAVVPAAAALAQDQAPVGRQRPAGDTTPAPPEESKLEITPCDSAAVTVTKFFSAPQMAALRKLSEIIMPPIGKAPGAIEAQAPEFLDFLIGQSPTERQQLYRTGLDLLNAQAKRQFKVLFSECDAAQTETILAPLRKPWQFDPPADPLERFLVAAKQDIRTATMNSREFVTASSGSRGGGGRRFGGGSGLYWHPIE